MKAIVVYSGGPDSTVLLCHLLDGGHESRALSFDYGKRHARELAAAAVASLARVEHRVVAIPGLADLFSAPSAGRGQGLFGREAALPEGARAEDNLP